MPDCLESLEFHGLHLSTLNNPNVVIDEATTSSSLAKFAQPSKCLGGLAHSHPDNNDR